MDGHLEWTGLLNTILNLVWLLYARPATNVCMEKNHLWQHISASSHGMRGPLPAIHRLLTDKISCLLSYNRLSTVRLVGQRGDWAPSAHLM
jgi:hypothetical protein